MRGTGEASASLFSYEDLEARTPTRHPMRKIRHGGNDALASHHAAFAALYTDLGRPSIAPERLTEVRNERRPNSRYASIENCRYEVDAAERMMKRENIRWLSSTTL